MSKPSFSSQFSLSTERERIQRDFQIATLSSETTFEPKGFTQPPVDHCWSHQGYQGSYWLPLGYISLMDSDPGFTYGDGSHFGSSLLAFGGTLGTVTDVPEPLTLSLFSAGLLGAFSMRRKAKKA